MTHVDGGIGCMDREDLEAQIGAMTKVYETLSNAREGTLETMQRETQRGLNESSERHRGATFEYLALTQSLLWVNGELQALHTAVEAYKKGVEEGKLATRALQESVVV